MQLKQFYNWTSLLLAFIACQLTQLEAKPTYDSYDLDNYERRSDSANSYTLTYGKPLKGDHLDNLDTGYYYVDNGYIAPVPSDSVYSARSLDSYSDDAHSTGYRISPIVRYRRTHTKRKKLFVPNFFG